jgi:hypothetical protein
MAKNEKRKKFQFTGKKQEINCKYKRTIQSKVIIMIILAKSLNKFYIWTMYRNFSQHF